MGVKKLVINADDFGLTSGVNRAILELRAAGAVTSVSQLSGGMPLEGSGVHLRLTDGKPCLPAKRIKSLVGKDGNFPRYRRQIGDVAPDEVRAEWLEQIEAHSASHLDTHSHSHAIPEVFEVYAELCAEMECAGVPLSPRQRCVLRQMGVPCADYAEIRWTDGEFPTLVELLTEDLARYDTVHLMCHPGYVDDGLRQRSSMIEGREKEIAVLRDRLPAWMEAQGVAPIRMAELPHVDSLGKVDILYLASNRRQFTITSAAALRLNTDWSRVRLAHIYHDGESTDGTLEALRAEVALWPCEVVFHETSLGSPVAVMNHYLLGDPAEWFAKIDNDTMVPPGWLPACLDALRNQPYIDLLGIEATRPLGDGRSLIEPSGHIGGIGLMRSSAFTELPKPHGRSGFGEWQNEHLEAQRGWLNPSIPVFLLDRLPFEPWASLSAEYEAKGWQRPWKRYTEEDSKLWEWWSGEARQG